MLLSALGDEGEVDVSLVEDDETGTREVGSKELGDEGVEDGGLVQLVILLSYPPLSHFPFFPTFSLSPSPPL